jgi:acyl-CoA thioester hydrolase
VRALHGDIHAGESARGAAVSQRFSIEEPVRWSDVDIAGVVCYGAFVRFFEIAESELMRAAGMPYGKVFDRFDIWLPRVRYTCDFRAPARLDERLNVSAWIKRMGERSIAFAFQINKKDDAELVAECEIVLACVERKTWVSRALPVELREALKRFLV